MIHNYQCIEINKSPEEVFELIDNMADKFPTFKFLSTTPFLFLRLILVDGFRTTLKLIKDKEKWYDIKKTTG